MLGQLDSSLPAELDDDCPRFLCLDDIIHIFRRQRIEIESVRCIKIRGNGFRIVVDDDGFVACFFERPDAVD